MRLEIKCTDQKLVKKCLSCVHMGICGMEQSVILNVGLVIVSLGTMVWLVYVDIRWYVFEKGSMDKLISSL